MAEINWLKTKCEYDKEHYLHLDRVYKTHLYHNKKSHLSNLLDTIQELIWNTVQNS